VYLIAVSQHVFFEDNIMNKLDRTFNEGFYGVSVEEGFYGLSTDHNRCR